MSAKKNIIATHNRMTKSTIESDQGPYHHVPIRHLLLFQVVGILDPGFTRWRGMVLQSFVVAWLDLAKEDAEHGRIPKTEFKARDITPLHITVKFSIFILIK